MLNTTNSKLNMNESHKMQELSCAICGSRADVPFKGHHICRGCLEYIKSLAFISR